MDSGTIRISPSKYAAVEIRRRAAGAVSLMALPLAVCAVAGLALDDCRYILVGLMLVFVIYPGVAAVAWLSLAADVEVAVKVRPQVWSFCGDSACLTFYSCGDESVAVDSVTIPFETLKKFEIRGKFAYFYTEVPTFGSKGDYYIVPASLLPSGLARRLTEQIYEKQQ